MKHLRRIFIFVLLIALIFGFFAPPLTTVLAADVSDTLDFITGVSLTNRDGTPLGDNVSKDAELMLTYTYAIANDADVDAGDTFTIDVPDAILISVPGGFDLTDVESGQIIGTGVITTSNTITITFTSFVDIYSNIHGSFWFDLAFDEDGIGYDDPAEITFEVGEQTEPYIIEIDFDQPAPPEASVQKTGSYNATTDEITWSITINSENLTIHDVIISDDIALGQTYVADSLKINGVDADIADYTYIDDTLTYTFPDTITTQQVLTFRVSIDDSEFIFDDAHGETIIEGNSANFTHDGTTLISEVANVNVPVDFIHKSGSYDSTDKQIDWTITVNNNQIHIPDAVLSDTLPTGLTLDEDSIEVDGTPLTLPNGNFTWTSADTFTYNFGDINETHTFTFSTDVDADLYLSNGSTTYTNNAILTGTNVPNNATDGQGVGVSSTVIRKTGMSYNPATAEITWRIIVNSNQVLIEDAVISDEIRIGQEYVDGSFSITAGSVSGSMLYTPASIDDPDKTGTLTYTFDDDINSTYTITFRTHVTDPENYATNSSIRYYNTAAIAGTNIPGSSSTGNRLANSNVLSKTGTDYNYVTRELTWTITVNNSGMPLSDVVVIDEIPIGQEYVSYSTTLDCTFDYTPAASGDPDKTGTLTFTANSAIDQSYTITVVTKLTDLSIFETNGDKILTNSASLTHDLIGGEVTTSGNRTIQNTVISKTGDYSSGDQYIDWTIKINTNNIALSSAVITDVLQEGLELDSISVQLHHLITNPDGSTTIGSEVALESENVQYDFATRTFTFTIPSPVSGAYALTFRTIVVDKTQSPFTNQADFNGTGTIQDGTSEAIVVAWAGSGNTGVGEVGSITVYKVDSDDETKFLEGCTFGLIDRYGNMIQQSTTDSTGAALFNWLRFDVDYTVVEITPPEGYLISDEEYTFQIGSADEEKDIAYTYADDEIKGTITLTKYDLNEAPVEGTEFTLYDSDDQAVAVAYSDVNGLVTFNVIAYGEYYIKETQPALGYYSSDTILYATISEDGDVVDAGVVTNEPMLGNIQIKKTTRDGTTPLAGATLGLYRVGSETPIMTDVSDGNGNVIFTDVVIGNYIIKEITAPKGYLLSDQEIEVSLREVGETVDAGILINTVEPPDTGDHISGYYGFMLFALIGIFATLIAKKTARTKIIF